MKSKQLLKAWLTLFIITLSGVQMSHAQGTSPTGISWPTGIKLDKTSLTLVVGESEQLTATVQPGNAPQDVEWWVESNDDVVTVSESGLVYAKAVGTATVMVASTHDISIYTACNVTVIPEEDTDISRLNNVIYLEKTEVLSNSASTLSFKMKNSAKIRDFQFDLYLPAGVTAVKNDAGRIQGALSDGRRGPDDLHTLTIKELEGGVIRFLCNAVPIDEALTGTEFTGTEGEVAILKIKVDEIEDGDYPIIIKNQVLSDRDLNSYKYPRVKSTLAVSSGLLGDVNNDGDVDVTDFTGVVNHILQIPQSGFNAAAADVNNDGDVDVTDCTGIANFIATQSFYGKQSNLRKTRSMADSSEENFIYIPQTEFQKKKSTEEEVTLSFYMKNTAAICNIQFDLYLPEGFSAVKKSNGKYDSKLADARRPEDDNHTVTANERPDEGAIRFVVTSTDNMTFTGNDGELLTLKVKLAADLTSGEYPITIKQMKLVESYEKSYPEDYKNYSQEYIVKVTEASAIMGIIVSSQDEVIYDLSGRRTNKPQQKGIYIVNGEKVVIK